MIYDLVKIIFEYADSVKNAKNIYADEIENYSFLPEIFKWKPFMGLNRIYHISHQVKQSIKALLSNEIVIIYDRKCIKLLRRFIEHTDIITNMIKIDPFKIHADIIKEFPYKGESNYDILYKTLKDRKSVV